MAEEFLDIVNENNELSGESASRSKIHAEGIWHRTVHIFVFRKYKEQVEFLVHLRAAFKDKHPNKWATSFGGHIKSGLSVEDGVRAELEEEIGIDVEFEKLRGGYWHKRDKNPNREFSKSYCLEYDGKLEDLKFNDEEVQTVKWLSFSEIMESIQKNPEKWAGSGKGIVYAFNYLIGEI